MDQKVSDFDQKLGESKNVQELANKVTLKTVNTNYNCKECSLRFGSKVALKKHIKEHHPKEIECNLCDETFDQIWKLEKHMATHSAEKAFTCNICEKKFALHWRLKKHLKGHTDKNVKFCHYYNNNINCFYEETSGCMFRHETAPTCKNLETCKYEKCQFSHTNNADCVEDFGKSDQIEEVEEETSTDDNKYKKCEFCNEIVDHSQHHLRTCSNCDFTSKCWAEDNKHWNETPDHNFSVEELRNMGYKI